MSWGATKLKRANRLTNAGIVWCQMMSVWTFKKYCKAACEHRGITGPADSRWKNKHEALDALRDRESATDQKKAEATI